MGNSHGSPRGSPLPSPRHKRTESSGAVLKGLQRQWKGARGRALSHSHLKFGYSVEVLVRGSVDWCPRRWYRKGPL